MSNSAQASRNVRCVYVRTLLTQSHCRRVFYDNIEFGYDIVESKVLADSEFSIGLGQDHKSLAWEYQMRQPTCEDREDMRDYCWK